MSKAVIVRFLLLLTLLSLYSQVRAATIHYAPSAVGSNDGSTCANAYAFTDSTHGMSVSGSYVPDNVLFMCQGTYGCLTVGSTGITVSGAGTSGHPITIQGDTAGPVTLTCAAWGNAIFCNNFNYITLDGGFGMTITNTANGTGLPNSISSNGVDFESCDHSEIRKVTVNPIYVRTGHGEDGFGTYGIALHAITTGSVHDNTIIWAGHGIDINYLNGASGISVYGNTTDYHFWGMGIGDLSGGSNSANNVNVYTNTIGPHFDAFLDTTPQTVHGDGIIINSGNSGGGVLSNSNFYNNKITSDMSCDPTLNSTGLLFFAGGNTAGFNNVNVFNNLLGQVCPSAGSGPEAIIVSYGTVNSRIVNNTLFGVNSAPAGINDSGSTNLTVENDLFLNVNYALLSRLCGFTNYTTINHNDYFGQAFFGGDCTFAGGGVSISSFAVWKSAPYNFEANGSNLTPNLNASFVPQAPSAAINLGTNLCSLSIAALDSDKSGTARPCPSGAWDSGAYQSGSTPPPPPSPGSIIAPGSKVASGTSVVQFNQEVNPQAIGNWQGIYGADGYDIANSTANLPRYVTVKPINSFTWTWEGQTNDARGLLLNGSRFASCWYNNNPFYFDISFSDGKAHLLEIYCADWDSYQGTRGETITLTDMNTGKVLDTRTLTDFRAGAWISWVVGGHLHLTVTKTAGVNGVISALMFG